MWWKKKVKKSKNQDLNDTQYIATNVSNEFANATGLQLVLKIAKFSGVGVFMGMSDAIPGYSGGTTLSLIGYFKKIIFLAKSVFIPEKGITRLRALLIMLPFACGWMIGIFGFAHFTSFLVQNHLALELLFFFSTFVLTTVPLFLIRENPKMVDREHKKLRKTWLSLFFTFGFLVTITLALVVRFVIGGITMEEKVGETFNSLSHLEWLKLAGVSFFAGAITLLPGGSGAIIQLMTGEYKNIHWIMLTHVWTNIGGLILYAFMTFFGMLTMVFVMAWGLKRHREALVHLSFGMLIASVPTILIIPEPSTWDTLSHWYHILGIIATSIGGASCGVLTYFLTRKYHKK